MAWTEGPNSSYLLGGWTGPFWRCCGLPGPRPQHVGDGAVPCVLITQLGSVGARLSLARLCLRPCVGARARARECMCAYMCVRVLPWRKENALLRPSARHTREPPWRPHTLILVP